MSAPLHPVPQNYGVARWGAGYFGIDARGRVVVRPDPDQAGEVDLHELALRLRRDGLAWPVLVRFVDILHHRVRLLCRAFAGAAGEFGYTGGYTAVYPVKVNQQRSVVEEILAGGGRCVGLEAGSKPELMAVLAVAPRDAVIVCNGYKDREYLRLALIGQRLGHRVHIVVEKPSELELALSEAEALGVAPLLGVRVRLAAVASGKWQNSGGERAKFGLSATQLHALLERLRAADRLDRLVLLHSHIGSQIPNLRDIRRGLEEAARYYAELRRLGAPIEVVDVGGGLGVDYEGTGTRHYCSMNYGLEAYAREVVKALHQVCAPAGLPHPRIFTESGRAMTAHHAVLITNVIDREPPAGRGDPPHAADDDPPVLRWLARELAGLGRHAPEDVYQEGCLLFDEACELFAHGDIDLAQRVRAEQLYQAILQRVRGRLRPESRRDRELLERLNERLAERVFCNFSLFQSLPDAWAIGQVFPVMPLQRLAEPPGVNALLHDLTCDSDGRIDHYVDQEGVERTLPLHPGRPGEPYLLGIFLVGAYQEILGDMHNLFGDTHAVNLSLDGEGGYRLSTPEPGDRVEELLRYLHFDPREMLARYREKLAAAGLEEGVRAAWYLELAAGLGAYTYLGDRRPDPLR